MESCEHPRLIVTFSIAELRADAAMALVYSSDETLKHEIETIERPLDRLGTIRCAG